MRLPSYDFSFHFFYKVVLGWWYFQAPANTKAYTTWKNTSLS